MPRGADDKNAPGGERWAAHPVLAALVMLVLYAVPLGVSMLAVVVVARANPLGSHRWLTYGLLAGTALGVSMLLERAMRRLLPIATLLRLTMLFPDRAPSRFKVARTAASSTRIQFLDQSSTASQAAEGALALMAALGTHDRRTRGHSERVRVFCDMLAEQLKLDQADRDRLRWASLLHDIGKLQIPTRLLNKPDRLDRGEFALMKTHPEVGAELTAALLPWLGEWSLGILEHHEKYDGTGYPAGRAAHDISAAGRIIGLVDAFETMTAARSYKKAMATRSARSELARCAGTHFDPMYVRAFLGVSLPRLIWAMGPLTFLLQLPFLRTFAQAGTRSVAAGNVAATVAGAAAIAGAGVTGAYAGAPTPAPLTVTAAGDVTSTPVAGPTAPASVAPPAPVDLPLPSTVVQLPADPVAGPTVPAPAPLQGPTAPATAPSSPPSAPEPIAAPATTAPPAPSPAFIGPTLPPVLGPTIPVVAPVATPTPAPPVLGPTVPAAAPTPPPTLTPVPASAPVTTVTAPNGSLPKRSATLTFAADQAGSTFTCSVDGGAYAPCASPLTLTGLSNGTHTVDVIATNPATGTGPAARGTVTVAVPPIASIVSGPTSGATWTTTSVALQLAADDPAATFECSTDGSAFAPCSSTPTFSLRNGPAQIWVRALNGNGAGPAATTGPFTVAQPLPRVILANVPTTTYDTASYDVATDDSQATLTCQLDGGAATPCTGTQTYGGLSLGSHTVTVTATNPLTGSTTQRFTFTSVAAPAVTITSSGVLGATADVQFTGTNASSYECALDGGPWSPCTSPASFVSLAPGSHVVAVRGIGPAGPGAPVQTPPMSVGTLTSFTTAPTGSVIQKNQAFAIAPVAGATYECSVDGGAFTACVNPMTLNLDLGTHTVQMRAVVGFLAQPAASATYTIVNDTVSLTSVPPSSTSATSATFGFSAAAGLSFECSLRAGGYTPCASPQTYSGLVPGSYSFKVRAVDSSGATGNAVTYAWSVI